MNSFDLTLSIAPSDKDLRDIIGTDVWYKIKGELTTKHENKCQGCGFSSISNEALQMHVISINEEKPEESDFALLCSACHCTQHLDVSAKQEWVVLVNSVRSQMEIVRLNRAGKETLSESFNNNDIVELRLSPLEYAEKLKETSFYKDDKMKISFTDKFDWK